MTDACYARLCALLAQPDLPDLVAVVRRDGQAVTMRRGHALTAPATYTDRERYRLQRTLAYRWAIWQLHARMPELGVGPVRVQRPRRAAKPAMPFRRVA